MVRNIILERINQANDYIDNGQLDAALTKLQNTKYRIHDEKARVDIDMFEREHDEKIEQRLKQIDDRNEDPLRKDNDRAKLYFDYVVSYLEFYDNLTLKYDI